MYVPMLMTERGTFVLNSGKDQMVCSSLMRLPIDCCSERGRPPSMGDVVAATLLLGSCSLLLSSLLPWMDSSSTETRDSRNLFTPLLSSSRTMSDSVKISLS